MTLRRLLAGALLLLALVCGGLYALWPEGPPQFRTVEITRADVRTTVSSTGTLQASTTVEVGTQVSGRVAELAVDFNDRVAAGQVLARIDTSVLEADVASARAAFQVARAERDQAMLQLERAERLQGRQAAARQEHENARTAAEVAEARLRSAGVALERARTNLAYATITSPIDGTVVRRDVEAGQTVNAGLQAPTLFLLAGDLATMRILTTVDEADIGRIEDGQRVEFTVQAWPDRRYEGRVEQVRLQSETVENVVTYTVVVAVDNEDGRLLPGMTATVEFVVAEVQDVLCAPNAALRYRPEPDHIAPTAREAMGAAMAAGRGMRGGRRGGGGARVLWVEGAGGQLEPLRVQTGLADASCTEVSGEGVREGLPVVAGIQRAQDRDGPRSPFQQERRRWRPGGF